MKPFFPPPPKAEAPYRKGATRVSDDAPEKVAILAWWWGGLALFAVGGAISYERWRDVILGGM